MRRGGIVDLVMMRWFEWVRYFFCFMFLFRLWVKINYIYYLFYENSESYLDCIYKIFFETLGIVIFNLVIN